MKKWFSLIALCFGQMFVIYDLQVVEMIAKPLILKLGAGHIQVLNFEMNYVLMFACFSIIASYLGLFWGWKNILRAGIFLFLISQSVMYFSSSMGAILFARLLSGLGAACVVPSLISLAMAIYKELNERAIVFAVFGSIFVYFKFEALFVVDYLLNQYGNQATYLVLIFFGITSYVLSFMIPNTEMKKPEKFILNFKAMAQITIFIFMFLFGFSRAPIWGVLLASNSAPMRVLWFLSPALALIWVSKFFFIYFVKHEIAFEKQNGFSIMPTGLLKNSTVVISLVQIGMVFGFLASPMLLLLEYLKDAMELSAKAISGVFSIYSCAAILFFLAMPIFMLKQFTAKSLFMMATIGGTIGSFFVFYSIGVDDFNATSLYMGLVLFAFHNAVLLVLSCLLIMSNIGQRDAEQASGTMLAYKHVLSTFIMGTSLLVLSLFIGVTFRIHTQDADLSDTAKDHFREFTVTKALTTAEEFLSDSEARHEAEELNLLEEDAEAFVEYNKYFRAYSIAKSIIVIGLLFLLNLLFAKKIPQEILLGRKKQ